MKIETIKFYFNLFLRITLVIALPISIWERNALFVFLTILTFILTFLPNYFENKYSINIPSELEIVIVLFIYSGIFLGGVRNYYYIYWWWDSLLHAISGVALGFIGFLILYIMHKTGKFKASPLTLVFFSFCFALSLGAVWEIFEFGVDATLGYNMQKARSLCVDEIFCDSRLGVVDTMYDLILDALGALFASIAGYFYLKNGELFLFDRLVKKFEKENKILFKNK